MWHPEPNNDVKCDDIDVLSHNLDDIARACHQKQGTSAERNCIAEEESQDKKSFQLFVLKLNS